MFAKAIEGVKAKYLLAGVLLAGPMMAFAQVAGDPFDTVLSDIKLKVATYAGGLVVLAGISVVFMVGIKYVKKIRGAA